MSNEIVAINVQQLLENWLEAERTGVGFPVPLHDHWSIAGHKKQQDAFNLLESRQEEGFDYLRSTVNRSDGKAGRRRQARFLSVAALERFCLAAHTSEGDAIRELYRQSKAKWDLVQKQQPEIAHEIELQHLKNEALKLEAQKEAAIAQGKQADLQLIQFRHIVTTTMPEVIQQKILGYTEVKTVEYRDRVIYNDDVIRDGSTINKTEMCRRLGILTRSGAPDYKRLNAILCQMNLPQDSWRMTASLRENEELTIEAWQIVLNRWMDGDRNLQLGE